MFPDLVTEPGPKSQMAPLPEKVLSLADIVSLTFRRFRLYYKLYFKTLFWPAFFCSLASHIAYLSLQHWVSIAATSLLAATPFILHMGVSLLSMVVWFFSAWELAGKDARGNAAPAGRPGTATRAGALPWLMSTSVRSSPFASRQWRW